MNSGAGRGGCRTGLPGVEGTFCRARDVGLLHSWARPLTRFAPGEKPWHPAPRVRKPKLRAAHSAPNYFHGCHGCTEEAFSGSKCGNPRGKQGSKVSFPGASQSLRCALGEPSRLWPYLPGGKTTADSQPRGAPLFEGGLT